jgi:hypothetical protein
LILALSAAVSSFCANDGETRPLLAASASHSVKVNRWRDFTMLHSASANVAQLIAVICDIMPRCAAMGRGSGGARSKPDVGDYPLARASPASRTSILRSPVPSVTRSGKSSRSVLAPACMSMPSGSQPVQRQSALSAPKSRVA